MNNTVDLSAPVEYEPFKQMSQNLSKLLKRKKELQSKMSEEENIECTRRQDAHWKMINTIARKQQRIISIVWSVIWICTLQLIGIMIAVGKETFFEDKCKSRGLKINQKEKYQKMERVAIEEDKKETTQIRSTSQQHINEMKHELEKLDQELTTYQHLYDGWKFRGEMAISNYDLSGDVDDAISWLVDKLPRYEGAVFYLEAIGYAWDAFERSRAEVQKNIEEIKSTLGEIFDAMYKGKRL